MYLTAISDLHGEMPELPGGDLLIMAGDATACDTIEAWTNFFLWFNDQEYTRKIFIAGNHDSFCAECETDDIYLCDSGTEFQGLKIWGTPWSTTFAGINPRCSAFTGTEDELDNHFQLIPDDVDILVTHTPPWGILDEVSSHRTGVTRHCGSVSLRKTLDYRIKPKYHFFGHIHERGAESLTLKRPGHGTENNTLCYNCSFMDEDYEPRNKVINLHIDL